MKTKQEDLIDWRLPSASELGAIVKSQRETNKWTQATLAEIAKVTERTIQRVERGLPSSFDTRRAISGAFGFKDLDTFDKPLPFPNSEKWQAFEQELEQNTVLIPVTKIDEGRTLRFMVEGAGSSATTEIGKISVEAQEAFAQLVDYLRDYNEIRHDYSMSERLEVDKHIDELIKTIRVRGAELGAGLRRTELCFRSDAPRHQALRLD